MATGWRLEVSMSASLPVHGTPRSLGYRMPAEWEPHEATWLAWPHNREDWPGKFHPIPWLYAEIVRLLARHETVRLLVQGEQEEKLFEITHGCLEVLRL